MCGVSMSHAFGGRSAWRAGGKARDSAQRGAEPADKGRALSARQRARFPAQDVVERRGHVAWRQPHQPCAVNAVENFYSNFSSGLEIFKNTGKSLNLLKKNKVA